jgi:hypothetical protein
MIFYGKIQDLSTGCPIPRETEMVAFYKSVLFEDRDSRNL